MIRKGLKVLKFDDCYPENYFDLKKHDNQEAISRMSYNEYYNWLMNQRSYLSDYFTFSMNFHGWETREFIVRDATLIEKLKQYGEIKNIGRIEQIKFSINFFISTSIKEIWRFIKNIDFLKKQYSEAKYNWYVQKYIETYNPDVLLIREPITFNGNFFEKYVNSKLIVSILGGNTKYCINWREHRNDLMLVFVNEYFNYFNAMQIPAIIIEYGVDERINKEVNTNEKIYDATFIGLLGIDTQKGKSELMNNIAQHCNFKWWGIKGKDIKNYTYLEKTWQGETSGIDLFQIYKQSKIVVNDYVEMARGAAVNLRIKEVFSVGTFLLTRYSENLNELENKKCLATFTDNNDCIAKINYYLKEEIEREEIASNGLNYALSNLNYKKTIIPMMEKIQEVYDLKKNKL